MCLASTTSRDYFFMFSVKRWSEHWQKIRPNHSSWSELFLLLNSAWFKQTSIFSSRAVKEYWKVICLDDDSKLCISDYSILADISSCWTISKKVLPVKVVKPLLRKSQKNLRNLSIIENEVFPVSKKTLKSLPEFTWSTIH